MHRRSGGYLSASSMSISEASGMLRMPSSRPIRTFFLMLNPSVATTRPLAMAASAICWMRCRWLAKLAVMMRRPVCSANNWRSTAPTDFSLGAWPHSSELVLSANSRRTPSVEEIAPNRARSVRRSSTGVRSSLKSPECTMTPCGVCNTMAWACGTLCVTGMNSTSNGPIMRRSPSFTTTSSVRPIRPASSMRLRARPSVTADP
ncbi:unannotated protein [freshwater metagenome]|uniref:Unannotated protein n=1 Tax=freshwater metagenome TaxID=449393 RepID=A0A6J7E2R2_9ZZZZ